MYFDTPLIASENSAPTAYVILPYYLLPYLPYPITNGTIAYNFSLNYSMSYVIVAIW
ncbi:MAG TPA: hypothetical protein VIL23_01595 [Clostridia bacterium]